MKKKKEFVAFVIMCFDKDLTIIYEKVIKSILEIHHFKCVRADEITKIGVITQQIEEWIKKCDLIVCDLTYNSPNVFFELGMAHSLKKNVIHITQDTNNIPFDLKDIRMIPYQDTKTGLLDLRDNLSNFIMELFPDSQDYSHIKTYIKYEINPDIIEEQRLALLSSVSRIKHYAIKFLGDCADTESYDRIERIAGIEKDSDILRDAFGALYKINPQKAKQTLIELGLLRQADYLVRERVVLILGYYTPDKELVQQLKFQLDDDSWGVRRAVCEVFGKWGITDNDVKVKLFDMLVDKEAFIRFAAREALEKISLHEKEQKKEKGKEEENVEGDKE